jgi:hypothetical protein
VTLAVFLGLLASCGGKGNEDAGTAADEPAGATANLPTHPHELARLRADATFPRFTAAELRSAGYPDHLHAYEWPGYEPPRDAAGETYGPRSLCPS